MYVVCVTIQVKAGTEDAFVEATRHNHQGTIAEPGALRFDVLRSAEDPQRFFLYEVYRDEAAFLEHKQTAHYATWRDTVEPWMAVPRQGLKYHSIFPADADF
ncbi:MAG: antibiotic biosynthesis monooxygenase [Deltaproteobacteria bacterium]|nr:antibiotic biosynthesis monooxygenase [Deltaproteobacteria bacterium]